MQINLKIIWLIILIAIPIYGKAYDYGIENFYINANDFETNTFSFGGGF